MAEELKGFNIANVEMIKIETEDDDSKTLLFKTASNCDCQLVVDSGQEVVQRVKNTIMGMLKTDDLVKGYDITMEDQRMIVEVLELIDGGKLDTGSGMKYSGPIAGEAVARKKFALTMYTSDRDTGGNVNSYHAWKFSGCKGTPVSFGGKDNEFRTTSYVIQSRPATGSPVMTLEKVESLPTAG